MAIFTWGIEDDENRMIERKNRRNIFVRMFAWIIIIQ